MIALSIVLLLLLPSIVVQYLTYPTGMHIRTLLVHPLSDPSPFSALLGTLP